MKYITVTLNPSVDRNYILSSVIKPGELNRCDEMSKISYSGKGINVSRELFRLGVDSKMFCILSGSEGKEAYDSLIKERLNVYAVLANGRMRSNISVLDKSGHSTDINEPGEKIEFKYILDFLRLYDKEINKPDEKVVVISGSVPPGFREDIYKSLIINAKKAGAYVVLDADGENLKKGVEGRPDLIKPNEKELSFLTGCRLEPGENEKRTSALAASSLFFEKTGIEVLCTLGEAGSVFAGKKGKFTCPAVLANVKRLKGAGDMYLARYLYETKERHKSISEAMKKAAEKTARNLEL